MKDLVREAILESQRQNIISGYSNQSTDQHQLFTLTLKFHRITKGLQIKLQQALQVIDNIIHF